MRVLEVEQGRCRTLTRIATEDGSKEQRHLEVAVFTIYLRDSMQRVYASTPHALCLGDRGSSNDYSLHRRRRVEGDISAARDQIDHHLPPCTAIVWEEERSPTARRKDMRKEMHKRCALPEL